MKEMTNHLDNTNFTVKVELPAALTAISSTNVYEVTNNYSLSDYCTSGVGSQPAITCFIAHNSYGGDTFDPTVTTLSPCVPGVAGTGVCLGAGALASNIPYMNDMVFSDANGQTPLADGTYFAPIGGPNHLWFTVVLGVVRCIKNCTDTTPCSYL